LEIQAFPDEKFTLDEVMEFTRFNIKSLLIELQNNMSNEVTLYQLKSNIMRVFEESDLLQTLGVSISNERTFHKAKPNGYRAEFIGLNLDIRIGVSNTFTENGYITLPIECQVQTIEQERDGSFGHSAHINRNGKRRKLKSVPLIQKGMRYSDPSGILNEYIEFLSFVKNISPAYAEAKASGDRIIIIPKDVYGEYEQILQAENRN